MEFKGKRVLLSMVYYTVIALMVALAITFMVYLATSDIGLYSKIGYFILTSLFVLNILFDIICTCINRMKFISGLILYVLTLATAIMGFVVYALSSSRALIAADIVNTFIALISLSSAIAILGIVVYTVGEKLVDYDTKR